MRKIEHTNQFKRDYKREIKGIHRSSLVADLSDKLEMKKQQDSYESKQHKKRSKFSI